MPYCESAAGCYDPSAYSEIDQFYREPSGNNKWTRMYGSMGSLDVVTKDSKADLPEDTSSVE